MSKKPAEFPSVYGIIDSPEMRALLVRLSRGAEVSQDEARAVADMYVGKLVDDGQSIQARAVEKVACVTLQRAALDAVKAGLLGMAADGFDSDTDQTAMILRKVANKLLIS